MADFTYLGSFVQVIVELNLALNLQFNFSLIVPCERSNSPNIEFDSGLSLKVQRPRLFSDTTYEVGNLCTRDNFFDRRVRAKWLVDSTDWVLQRSVKFMANFAVWSRKYGLQNVSIHHRVGRVNLIRMRIWFEQPVRMDLGYTNRSAKEFTTSHSYQGERCELSKTSW